MVDLRGAVVARNAGQDESAEVVVAISEAEARAIAQVVVNGAVGVEYDLRAGVSDAHFVLHAAVVAGTLVTGDEYLVYRNSIATTANGSSRRGDVAVCRVLAHRDHVGAIVGSRDDDGRIRTVGINRGTMMGEGLMGRSFVLAVVLVDRITCDSDAMEVRAAKRSATNVGRRIQEIDRAVADEGGGGFGSGRHSIEHGLDGGSSAGGVRALD